MPNLDLKEVRAGMVLGQDVLGAQGQLLLRAGAVLSDKHLQVLLANQVLRVAVNPTLPATVADAAMIETHIEARFRISDAGHPLIQELRRLCHKRFTPEHGEAEQ
ncbi:MAG: hypothetical protein HY941_12350 [Gammaproteobacteria bacterium]|nr:hypothetical protein [Gammaproteobacteria bacterium]